MAQITLRGNAINTVGEPIMIESGGPTQMAMSVTRAAGRNAINTVGSPGAVNRCRACILQYINRLNVLGIQAADRPGDTINNIQRIASITYRAYAADLDNRRTAGRTIVGNG